jgi:hypothetical protein
MLPYFLATASLLLALLAFARMRSVTRRFERLTESYWELRYEQGQLRARLDRLEGNDTGHADSDAGRAQSAGTPANFIPLTSLKR